MNNTHSNNTCHDELVHFLINNLANEYDNAIPVFGGAVFAHRYLNLDEPNLDEFIKYLPPVVSHARFFKWYEGVVGALRTFCQICSIDPMLIEAYIGMTFEKLLEVSK